MAMSRKGKFESNEGRTVAFVEYFPVVLDGETYKHNIRTTSCELLVHGPKCYACKSYRRNLMSNSLCSECPAHSWRLSTMSISFLSRVGVLIFSGSNFKAEQCAMFLSFPYAVTRHLKSVYMEMVRVTAAPLVLSQPYK